MPPDPSTRRRRDFARTILALAEVAPTFPPSLIAHGLELTHHLRSALGERPVEASLWEELLALRRGPGADAFLAMPLPPKEPEDFLLERAVEILGLVDAVRNNRHAHDGQPLDRVLRESRLRMRRLVFSDDTVPVAVRCGTSFAVVPVADDHPRALRDRIADALLHESRELGSLRSRRITAPLLVSLTPLPFAEAIHAHRIGVEGPWLSWSHSATKQPLGVLAAHHLVLEGPGFATLRADFRRRVRAMRVALGLDGADEGFDITEDFGVADAGPFDPYGGSGLHPSLAEPGLPDELMEALYEAEAAEQVDPRHTFAYDPVDPAADLEELPIPDGLPKPLQELAVRRSRAFLGERLLPGPTRPAPSIRYATIHRGAFSLPDFCYAYCRAQHDALAVHHPRYSGEGFTFIVPHLPRADGGTRRGRRGQPVLSSFRTRRGAPEGADAFKARLVRHLEEADQGDDLLSRVLDDVFRVAVPDVLKAAAVAFVERMPTDGGTFLTGRGLVARIEIDDEVVDPVARYAGVFEGLYGGSCQERGGVSLTAVDRGYRRDVCAVGTGIFRRRAVMDLFWQRFAYFLGQAAM